MKRRNFLIAAALGAGTFAKPAFAGIASMSSKHPFFASYIDAVGAIPQNVLFLNDAPLEALYRTASASLVKTGYKSWNGRFYYCCEDNTALFPLALYGPSSELLDISALFFNRNAQGAWEYGATFSGFHFEAIHRGLVSVKERYVPGELAALLVPVKSAARVDAPGVIATRGGQMELRVRIEEGRTHLAFRLLHKSDVLTARDLTSRHTLSCNHLSC